MEVIIDRKSHKLKAGDMFILFPRQFAQFRELPDEKPLMYRWIAFEGRRLKATLAQVQLSPGEQIHLGKHHQLTDKLLSRTEAAYRDNNYSNLLPVSAAWELLYIISSVKTKDHSSTASIAETARYILDENFSTGISIEEVAATLQISRSTLYRHFSEAYSVSPKEYLDNLRMNYACELLNLSRMSAGEVAYACGFQSTTYFNRLFRQYHGAPPKRWQQQQLKKKNT